jgi:hypothetical protein
MMFETYDPRPASKSFSTIYFRCESKKLTNVVECYKKTACIRSNIPLGPDVALIREALWKTGTQRG